MPPPPVMYGNPGYYPQHYVPSFAPGYDTASSKLYSDQEMYDNYYEEEEEESEQSNPAFRKGPGPILDQMLDEFYRGDDMLRGEKKRKGSKWSMSKGNQ